MIVNKARINSSYPFVGRAASRGVIDSINFTVINIAIGEIRKRSIGVPVEATDLKPALEALAAKYGKTLDERNEQDENARGEKHLENQSEEQGFAVSVHPMELAARLKVIADALNADLLEHATLMRNPYDPKGGTFPNPFEIGKSLEETLIKQISRQPKVNETILKAQADHLGVPYEDLLRIERQQQESSKNYLMANKSEILSMITNLEASGPDETVLGIEDAEEIEKGLPAIYRARMYSSADRGLWFENDNQIKRLRKGNPDAKGNMTLILRARQDIHAEFDRLMRDPDFLRGIEEAVSNGSTYPVLLDLPTSAKVQQAA